jgi:hypothetical protein
MWEGGRDSADYSIASLQAAHRQTLDTVIRGVQ